ncbi:MAG: sigma-70 family RNA polymerase sigma factor [Planctomycetota bacterium]
MRSRSRAGREVFEILVREHADMLLAYLRSSVDDPGAVDDLFQEAMIVAWKRLDDYDRTRPFGPWLRGIARVLVMAHYRRVGRSPEWFSDGVLDAIDARYVRLAERPGDSFRDRIEALAECIDMLSDRLRAVIEMAYGRGMTLRAIAQATNEQEAAIRKRAQRARTQLADCLALQGDGS